MVWAVIVFSTFFCPSLAKCVWNMTCPCGPSGTPFQFCLDTAPTTEDPCATWEDCATCRTDLNECLTCPRGLLGFKCRLKLKVSTYLSQNTLVNTEPCVVERGGRCGILQCPKSGSMRCSTSTSTNSKNIQCLGACLAGYTFQGYELENEIMLTCDENSWNPLPSFPDCIPYDHCDLLSSGNNTYNCTTTVEGKFCDIECHPPFQSSVQRYFCYPETGWTPSLPRCVKERKQRDTSNTTDSRNRGPRATPECRDPGQVDHANRLVYGDNTQRSRLTYFNERTSLMFYCDDGYELRGTNTIVCLSSGVWSSPLPRCISLTATEIIPVTRGAIECNDPGQVENSNRLLFTGTRSLTRSQTFLPGESVLFSCNTGYRMERGASKLICQQSGSWSSNLPTCRAIGDTSSGNSNPSSDDMPEYVYDDKTVLALCFRPDYIENGDWSVVFNPTQYDLEDEEFPDRTRIHFSCRDGYTIQGHEMLHCQDDGYWNSEMPSCVRECGRSRIHTRKKIRFGIKTQPMEWPWVVAIVNISTGYPLLSCGGSVIDQLTVLTAAHCLVNPILEKTSNIMLYFGKYYREFYKDDNNVVKRTPSVFIIHPRYDGVTLDNDIALIKLNSPITFNDWIQPVCLPTKESSERNLSPLTVGTVLGWGTTEDNLPSDQLMMVHLPYVSGVECGNAYKTQNASFSITGNMFCAGLPEGRKSACTGDSGGPIVFPNATTERYTIEGIVSFGAKNQCGVALKYTVFTLVINYIDWIKLALQ